MSCYCSGCQQRFSSLTSFDTHRVGQHGVDRRCAAPEDVGLVRNAKGLWTLPITPGEKERWLQRLRPRNAP